MQSKQVKLFCIVIISSIFSCATLAANTFDQFTPSLFIGGRLQTDAAFYQSDTTQLGNGTGIRRARLFARGQLFPEWQYQFEFDAAGNRITITDAYLRYLLNDSTYITIGHFKEFFSMEFQQSANHLAFLERALPNALSPNRAIGISIQGFNHLQETLHYTGAIGIFGERDSSRSTVDVNEGYALTGRATIAQHFSDDLLITVGASGSHRKPDSNRTLRYRSRPESNITSVRLVDTANISEVKSLDLIGLEGAAQFGALLVQSEYIASRVNRMTTPKLIFNGWYVQASLLLTGEKHHYNNKTGVFAAVKPDNPWGAWEIAGRISAIDLDSDSILGGREHNYSAGLNWYVNDYIRFMANVIKVHATRNQVKDNPYIFQLRAQVHFSEQVV
jgi:phosphate-selective porin OprO/OprP